MKMKEFFSAARIMGAAALTMGIVLAASVALTSCKKDETSSEPVTPATLKHLNDLVEDGYYGSVKSVTQYEFSSTNLRHDEDTLDVDVSRVLNSDGTVIEANVSSKYVREYNAAGYQTEYKYYSRNGTSSATLTLQESTTKTYDEKNRVKEYKQTISYGGSSSYTSRTTYDYTSVPGKCVVINYSTSGSGSEQEQSRTEYDLDADGYMDEGNYKRYNPLDVNDAPNQEVITKRDKDAAGNTTAIRSVSKYQSQRCNYQENPQTGDYEQVCEPYWQVNCSYTKYEISYY